MKEKKTYITEEERKKCRQVADAFAELYEIEDILALDAGRFGFVVLRHLGTVYGLDTRGTYTDSRALFERLWNEWLNTRLLQLLEGTAWEEETYEDMFKALPIETQRELRDKRMYFAQQAGIDIIKD